MYKVLCHIILLCLVVSGFANDVEEKGTNKFWLFYFSKVYILYLFDRYF